jgi:hypothetical protein
MMTEKKSVHASAAVLESGDLPIDMERAIDNLITHLRDSGDADAMLVITITNDLDVEEDEEEEEEESEEEDKA